MRLYCSAGVVAIAIVASSATITEGPTKEARCMDARAALAMADAALVPTISAEARVYWEAYKLGAQIGITTYCPQDGE